MCFLWALLLKNFKILLKTQTTLRPRAQAPSWCPCAGTSSLWHTCPGLYRLFFVPGPDLPVLCEHPGCDTWPTSGSPNLSPTLLPTTSGLAPAGAASSAVNAVPRPRQSVFSWLPPTSSGSTMKQPSQARSFDSDGTAPSGRRGHLRATQRRETSAPRQRAPLPQAAGTLIDEVPD